MNGMSSRRPTTNPALSNVNNYTQKSFVKKKVLKYQ